MCTLFRRFIFHSQSKFSLEHPSAYSGIHAKGRTTEMLYVRACMCTMNMLMCMWCARGGRFSKRNVHYYVCAYIHVRGSKEKNVFRYCALHVSAAVGGVSKLGPLDVFEPLSSSTPSSYKFE